MKKILIWEVLKNIGGGQKMSITIANALKEKYEVVFALPGEGEVSNTLEKIDIPYVIIPEFSMTLGKKKLTDIISYVYESKKQIQFIKRVIELENIDILYVPGPSAMPWGAIVGSLTGRSVVWHIHHIFTDARVLWILNLTGKLTSVKYILAPTAIAGNQIKSKREQQKLRILYNPIDIERYSTDFNKNALRKQMGICNNSFILAQIGFIQKSKNQEASIRALELLIQTGYDVKLWIIGDARENDTSYKQELQQLIQKKNLSNAVFFLGYRDDINCILHAVDVVVVMSSEGFSLAALEGMACNIPIVAIDQGGVAEIVKKANAGLLAAADKKFNNNIADTIIFLLENPAIAKSFGQNGRKFAEINDLIQFRKKVIRIFEELD